MDEAKNQINDLEHKEAKNNQSKEQEKRIQNNEESISNLCNDFKQYNICIRQVLEGKEKEQEIGNLFEKIMTENFPNLVKEIDMQVWKHRESQTR